MALTPEQRTVLEDRSALFGDTPINKGTPVGVRFELAPPGSGLSNETTIGATDYTGCVQGDVLLPETFTLNQTGEFLLTLPDNLNLRSEAKIMDTSPDGYGIFTDFDDTIKITGALVKPKLMQNVFMEPYLPVPSTPELFHNLQKTLAVNNTPPTIFYVSGSPMQTIDPYRTFLQEYFPPGETILQEFSISFRAIKNFLNYKVYKEVTADEVFRRFPQKKLYLIGDSGQLDPEAFAATYKKYGGDKVACIWILKTVGFNPRAEAVKNDAKRFEKIFVSVPKERWYTFYNGTEMMDLAAGQCRPSLSSSSPSSSQK